VLATAVFRLTPKSFQYKLGINSLCSEDGGGKILQNTAVEDYIIKHIRRKKYKNLWENYSLLSKNVGRFFGIFKYLTVFSGEDSKRLPLESQYV
jgi:hypothetical protein